MNGTIATAEVEISASPATVWDALTTPDLIKDYFFGATVETDWQPGSPITWSGEYDGKGYQDKGEILAVEPGKSLRMTHFSPLSGQPDEPGSYHELDFTITDEGDSVKVVLEQDNNPDEEAAGHAQENWQAMLDGLKKLVESGERA
ncbi:MAG: SRPBCC family protein [Nocardioides sp.]|uniref:SRPBCC family protein n=1 Tax=Nocardioides sp. TaxID=35761 RepID=UPI0039E31A72